MARVVGLSLVGVLALGGAAGVTYAATLTHNIKQVDATKVLAQAQVQRPKAAKPANPSDPNAGKALNILLLGTDSRAGSDSSFASSANTGGARADTTILMHISGNRSHIDMISIPRDTTVDVPSCVTANGKRTRAMFGQKFNAAFSEGFNVGGDLQSGALCSWQTVEKLTNVRLDGFMVVDFAGFAAMVDALHGVPICIPEEIQSNDAGYLHLMPGNQVLDGRTALEYARARHGSKGVGDQSDTQRITRQQELLGAIARDVLSKNLLTDAPQLLSFMNALTHSLTTSSNLASPTTLAGLGYSLRNLKASDITFVTVPWGADPQNPANVVWKPSAAALWANLNADRPAITPAGGAAPPAPAKTPTAGARASAPATPAPAPTPDQESFTGAQQPVCK